MPELPEVETIRVKLEPHLVGRTFAQVEISDPRLVRPFEPIEVAVELVGERVSALERRGKYLIVRFESGRALLIHLRMTGSLRAAANGALADDAHRRAVVMLDDGSNVSYRDVRRFGTWQLLEPGELEPYLDKRSRRAASRSAWQGAVRRSRPPCSTSAPSQASATSTSTRRCGARRSIR
jgi:formamidopyrimidine-DNA glycosylase